MGIFFFVSLPKKGCIPKMAEKFRPVRLALKARTAKAQGIRSGTSEYCGISPERAC